MSNKQAVEKERAAVFTKDIVVKNPIFSVEQIKVFFELFNLYADQRREASVSQILSTAKTLNFDKKHPLVYEAISQIAYEYDGVWIRFEQFLTELTSKLGDPKTESGRRAMFNLVDLEGKERLSVGDLLRLSDSLGFGLTPEEVQSLVKNIGGHKERELTWEQFNNYIAKKVEKKSGL